MKQTRLGSSVEAIANVVIGYLVAVFANMVVLPLFGYPVSFADANGIAVAFTFVSLIRSYLLRRLFNSLKFGHR